jgi:cold shock CspA family protein
VPNDEVFDPGPLIRARSGSVVSFDAQAGLGEVEDEKGRRFAFHATSIADGTRTIEVGAAVIFVVAPGLGGRFEARDLTPR